MTKPKNPAIDWEPDSRTGQACPNCGEEIVYNGNYFCSTYGAEGAWTPNPGWCGWAMTEDEPDDGAFFKRCYRGLMRNRASAGN